MGVLPEGPDAWENIVSNTTSKSANEAKEAREAAVAAKKEPRLVRIAAAQFQVGKDAASAVAACCNTMQQARAVSCDLVVLPGHAKAIGTEPLDGPFLKGVAAEAKRLEIGVAVALHLTDGVGVVLLDKKGATLGVQYGAKNAEVFDLHKFGGKVVLKTGQHAAGAKDLAGAELVIQSLNAPGACCIADDAGAAMSSGDKAKPYDLVFEDLEPAKPHYKKKHAFLVVAAPAK